jgi:16S rRNA (guanine(966)-N(2))-methyltransferase RsmD
MNILPPNGSQTRPITDRVKESIFDVLFKYNLIEGRYVADLFCGTGSFGLESISRGAKEAVFVDQDRRAIDVLRKNIEKARLNRNRKLFVVMRSKLEHRLEWAKNAHWFLLTHLMK